MQSTQLNYYHPVNPLLTNSSKKSFQVNNQISQIDVNSNVSIHKNKNYNQNPNHSHFINHNSSGRDDSRNYDFPNNIHSQFNYINHSVDYSYQGGRRNLKSQASRSFRAYPQQLPQGSLQAYIHILEQELQNTTYNYQSHLQAERKNASERSDFLLYLIQSLKIRHAQQLNGFKIQLANAQNEKQQSKGLEAQMKNIGQGVEQVHQQTKRLKSQNQQLQKQLSQQQEKQKELDEQIQNYKKQIEECRNKIDEWQRAKLKWNRQRKDLIELIQQTQRGVSSASQKAITRKSYDVSSSQQEKKQSQRYKQQIEQIKIQNQNKYQYQQQQSQNQLEKQLMEYNNQIIQNEQFDNTNSNNNKQKICRQTGFEEDNCQHCRQNNFEALFSKYKTQD